MDLEQILTQSLITVFTVFFIFVVCWAKNKIEKKYRKSSERIRQSTTRLKIVSCQEALLCKKVHGESTNRHQRSIIASSLMQTLDDELQKLQQISDSIKHVQSFPKVISNFQQIDTRFLQDHNTLDKTYDEEKENLVKSEAPLIKEQKPLMQTRLCKAWGDQAKEENNADGGKHIDPSDHRSDSGIFKNTMNDNQQSTTKYPNKLEECLFKYDTNIKRPHKNLMMNRNHSVLKRRNSHKKIKKSASVNISSCANKFVKIRKNSSCGDFKCSLKKYRKPSKTKKGQYYSCPNKSQPIENTKSNFETIATCLSLSKNDDLIEFNQLNKIKQTCYGIYDVDQTNHNKMNNLKDGLQIDLIFCVNKTVFKRRGKENNGNRVSVINSDPLLIEKMSKSLHFNKCQIGKKGVLRQIGLGNCIFKVPIKIKKTKIILKFIFWFLKKKGKDNNFQQSGDTKSETKKGMKLNQWKTLKNNELDNQFKCSKKLTIYTNSDKFVNNQRNNSMDYKLSPGMTFTDGESNTRSVKDVTCTAANSKAIVNEKIKSAELSDCKSEGDNNKAILSSFLQFTELPEISMEF